MKKIEFKIIEKCFQDASQKTGNDADFYLEENNWNDYYYYVLYHLHATKRITGSQNLFLGDIRIMKAGQQKDEKYLLRKQLGTEVFCELPETFVSISFDYKLYEWLSFQDVELRQSLAKGLHLIINNESPYYLLVKDDLCFLNALLRDATMDNYILHKADNWINQIERRYDLRAQKITLKYDNCDELIHLSFSYLPNVQNATIPNGIVAFIGANGSGKSTALYSLAKAMYLFPEDREKLDRQFCKIFPNDIGVERLILISYSPFDNFTIPTTSNFAMHNIQGQTREQDGRFIYCGIRDIDEEYRKLYENGKQKDFRYLQNDRQTTTISKTQERLAADFVYAFKQFILNDDKNRFTLWENIIDAAKNQHPDLAEKMMQMTHFESEQKWTDMFMCLSTGYKFFFHSIAHVIAYILEGSLVLFDEPENHIHPPLLSFMMMQYRKILANFKSVMLVSTHSPVIIQELFADNVLKIYREGEHIIIKKPKIETYGATFGEINSEVFDLTSDVSCYFSAIDSLYDLWEMSQKENANAMLTAMQQQLKRPLSNQMASYLISKFYGDNPNKN